MTKLNTYLNFDGNAEEAFHFYKTAFGGDFTMIVRFKDMPMPGATISDSEANKIMHIGLEISPDCTLMASDILPSMGQSLMQGNNSYISIHPDSRKEADRLFEALSSGGTIEMPIADQIWGDYWGSFKDQFGVYWMVDYSPPRKEA